MAQLSSPFHRRTWSGWINYNVHFLNTFSRLLGVSGAAPSHDFCVLLLTSEFIFFVHPHNAFHICSTPFPLVHERFTILFFKITLRSWCHLLTSSPVLGVKGRSWALKHAHGWLLEAALCHFLHGQHRWYLCGALVGFHFGLPSSDKGFLHEHLTGATSLCFGSKRQTCLASAFPQKQGTFFLCPKGKSCSSLGHWSLLILILGGLEENKALCLSLLIAAWHLLTSIDVRILEWSPMLAPGFWLVPSIGPWDCERVPVSMELSSSKQRRQPMLYL